MAFLTLTLFGGPIEVNLAISLLAAAIVAGILFQMARNKGAHIGSY